MGHVPHGPEHDADVAARGADTALKTGTAAGLVAFNAAAILLVAGLAALAAWQLQRRTWKLDLVARLEARIHGSPIPAPGRERWADISAAADEYRRVTVTGRWLENRHALVRAVTERGGGYWVMAPLVRDDGTVILVNRGFVPADRRDPAAWGAPNETSGTVTGLLRLSEPAGAFLRSNDPAADRWFSRDVAVIAESRALSQAAPYFVDAEGPPGRNGLPVPGLTVLSFANNHLVYALTWGALALMAVAGAILINVERWRQARRSPEMQADEQTLRP